ncbi:hypothetical protein NQ314_012377 [Rhamnusium bicolor]|uniref:Fibronectin type-III domain-containing protein n=1 Tax=Rhamnusium bicolor TaxID=1586634 RepID=A0AAV8XEP1_9CUCU|nr:hypothetical protein NQ314_012377 [Rhamnusium bicolor]
MGHAFVYVLVAICGVLSAQDTTTTEFYATTELSESSDAKFTKGIDTPTSDIAVPPKPRNLTVLDYTPDSIRLQWANPARTNGLIEGYRVYYMNNNFTAVQPDKIPFDEPLIRYNLTDLKPLTEYTIFVKAFTEKHEGFPSESVMATTDINGPSAPRVLNLSCQANETIFIQWERPSNYYYSIDYYYVYINLGNHLYDNITISTTKDHLETTYILNNLTPDAYYNVQIQASTRSNRTHRLIMGELSPPMRVYVSKTCEEPEDSFFLGHANWALGF